MTVATIPDYLSVPEVADRLGVTQRTVRNWVSWDASSREFVEPKSRAGTRTVPIIDRLAMLLADHRVLTNHPSGGLLFESDACPVSRSTLSRCGAVCTTPGAMPSWNRSDYTRRATPSPR